MGNRRITAAAGALVGMILGSSVGCLSTGTAADAGCQPENDQSFCERLGKNCEVLSAYDNCGTARSTNCGSCNGTCEDNVCQSATTSGTTGTAGAGTTAGASSTGSSGVGTSGSSVGSTGGGTTGTSTSGGTTTGGAGCTSTSCAGYPDIFTAKFAMKDWVQHDDSTIDALYGESITLIIGFSSGTPVNIQTGLYDYPNSTVSIAVSGDDAGVIASKMLAPWTLDGGISMTQDGMGNLDTELSPHDQSAAWFGLELYCPIVQGPDGPLVSASCVYPSFKLSYFNNAGALTDELFDQGAATMTLVVVDGG